jgi:outer membrane protein OmpA-like peptidoglycan-associated protein
MRHISAALLPVLALALGCSSSATSYVRSPETTLGRVVVYRNGVAYFERYADVQGDALNLQVPADKVDDFLKSLTVADATTNRPEPISYPTDVPSSGTGLIDMKIQLDGARPHKLKLTYVTEAPSWKPSYRITLGPTGKVKIQAWAIVDNTSGEDWRAVKLGVGSSSAMSFRFDLRHVRVVERETLKADDWLAIAPPLGGATYGNQSGPMMKNVLAELDDSSLLAGDAERAPVVATKRSIKGGRSKSAPSANGLAASPAAMPMPDSEEYEAEVPQRNNAAGQQNLTQLTQSLARTRGQILVEGYAKKEDSDKMAASLDRANRAREALIKNGIPPERVVALGRGEQPGKLGGVRIVEVEGARIAAPDGQPQGEPATKTPESVEPIGTSHFESDSPMTVPRGTSAMVSILNADAEGEVVYLYDPESQRGNEQFPFRSVRLKNPTTSALESGPVTVFGEGRFIGEGLSEPIPARAQAFIPFALDRQIVVERKTSTEDRIRRVITIQRGVFHSEVEHRQRVHHTLYNRLTEKTRVYVKHTVPSGYSLAAGTKSTARLGEAHLFQVDLEPGGKAELVIEETTPMFTTADIRSPDGMGLIRTYLASTPAESSLRQRVDELLKLHVEMTRIEQKIETTREQMAEYRTRMDELHAQIVTLRAVKTTSGLLLGNLEKKLAEISDKLSKATALVVGLQEQAMVTKIRFQDGVSELTVAQDENASK